MRKERYQEDDFKVFVNELLSSCRLEGKEAGIAKLVLGKGYDNLSEKQKFVFDRSIQRNTIERCQRCDNEIPWCEMLLALENGGYCGYCQHMMEKDE